MECRLGVVVWIPNPLPPSIFFLLIFLYLLHSDIVHMVCCSVPLFSLTLQNIVMKSRLNSFLPVRQKWFEVYPNEDEDETRYFERIIKGPRLSDRTRNILSTWLHKNSWRQHCACTHDCCGCQYEQTASWTYSAGQLVLKIKKYFNY